jgi:hypothetical protein
VQPGWGKVSNCGRCTGGLDGPMERRRGLRVPSADMPTGRGKGTRAAPILNGVLWPKAVVVVQRRVLGGNGDDYHDVCGGCGVGR